jgi:hypothetical protein
MPYISSRCRSLQSGCPWKTCLSRFQAVVVAEVSRSWRYAEIQEYAAFPNCTSESNNKRQQWSRWTSQDRRVPLIIRVPDTNAVQESSVIRRIDCRPGVWQIR